MKDMLKDVAIIGVIAMVLVFTLMKMTDNSQTSMEEVEANTVSIEDTSSKIVVNEEKVTELTVRQVENELLDGLYELEKEDYISKTWSSVNFDDDDQVWCILVGFGTKNHSYTITVRDSKLHSINETCSNEDIIYRVDNERVGEKEFTEILEQDRQTTEKTE